MSCENCGQIITEVRVVASLLNTEVNNALTLSNGLLQFGGPLVKNTDVTGLYILNFGTGVDRIGQFNINASSQVLTKFDNGVVSSSLLFNSSGILVTDATTSPKGLLGNADFKANYVNNSYVQKVYVDTRLVGRAISATLANPTITQNNFAITWDNTANAFTLSSASSAVPGATTQVIYNNAGVLAGDEKFVFDNGIGQLTVRRLQLGDPNFTGTETFITNTGTQTDISFRLEPKGAGNINLNITGGVIHLGATTGSFTNTIIRARGNEAQINISLEPKGTEGIIYIGSINEAGGFRYLQARGNTAITSLELRPQGNGEILVGNNTLSSIFPTIRASSSLSNATLRLAAKSGTFLDIDGIAGEVKIAGTTNGPTLVLGSAAGVSDGGSGRIIIARGSSPDINLFIYSKGLGKIYLNDITQVEIALPVWNMSSTSFVNVAININPEQIESIAISIVSDFAGWTPIDFWSIGSEVASGNYSWSGGAGVTNITVTRTATGIYTGGAYISTAASRGKVFVKYRL